jgi:hypothetical protein
MTFPYADGLYTTTSTGVYSKLETSICHAESATNEGRKQQPKAGLETSIKYIETNVLIKISNAL